MKKPYRDLATRIRREMAKKANTDFLRSLAVFRIQPLPREMIDLLRRLEDEENKADTGKPDHPPLRNQSPPIAFK